MTKTSRDMPVFEQFGMIVPWRQKALPWGNMECFRKRMYARTCAEAERTSRRT